MSKKILSLALALVMLVSVFTISAFAFTTPASGEVGIYTVSDAKVGQSSGTVTVDLYWVFPADRDLETEKAQIGNIVLGFNSAKYKFVSAEWSPEFAQFLTAASSYIGVKPNLWKAVQKKLTANDIAYGYNSALQFQLKVDAVNNPFGYTATSGFAVTADEEHKVHISTIKMEAVGELTANDVIGVIEGSIAGGQTKANASVNNKNVARTPVISGVAAPAGETYKVFDGDVKIRRNAADSAKYDLGFTGSFKKSDFPVVFNDAGTATNLTKVGVKVTMNGITNEYTDRFVYETADGYQFRAVLAGLDDSMADMEISVVMFIEFDGVRYESKGLTTTLGAHTGRLPA